MPSTPEALERVGGVRPQILPGLIHREGCFSFGNGCQAIEIVRACFGRFFQMRFEIVG